jgi:hypothetical protein
MTKVGPKHFAPKDICVYEEGISRLDDIVNRHRNEREEKIYKATLHIPSRPYAEIGDGNEVLVLIPTSNPNEDFYLLLNKRLKTKSIVRLTKREHTKTDFSSDEDLQDTLSLKMRLGSTFQKLHCTAIDKTLSNKATTRHFIKQRTVAVSSFTVKNLLKEKKTNDCECKIM